jgi:hypothetical protein
LGGAGRGVKAIALGLLAAASLCCSSRKSGPTSAGRLIFEGAGQALNVASLGGAAVYLREPSHPAGKLMPPDAYLGSLMLLATDGSIHRLGGDVTNLVGDVTFSPDGQRVAFLADFSFETHLGTLAEATNVNGVVQMLEKGTSYFGFSADGRSVGAIVDGTLRLRSDSLAHPVEVDRSVATFEFAGNDGLIYRRRSSEGGDLLFYRPIVGGKPQLIARRVADYLYEPKTGAIAYTLQSEDGTTALHLVSSPGKEDRLLGTNAPSFRFSPNGRHLAYVADATSHYLEGNLFIASVEGGPPALLGKRAGEYRFAPAGDRTRLAFVYEYYETIRSGKFALWDEAMGVLPVIAPVADSVRVFSWSKSGQHLGYLKRVTQPLYTEQLLLLSTAESCPERSPCKPKPHLLGEGIYAFDFTPDERLVLYKTACTREGEACDLLAMSSEPEPPKPLPDGGVVLSAGRKLASGIDDYDVSPDGNWLWITFKNAVGNTADLAVIPMEKQSLPRYVDFKVEPHPRWRPSGTLLYLVNSPKRAGLYEAEPAKATALRTDGRR